MKKIYISGAISGNEHYEEDFSRGENWVRLQDDFAVNTIKIGKSLLGGFSYSDYMNLDFKLIELCDGIYMLRGWEKSKGAKAELTYAKALGKEVHFESKQWALRKDEMQKQTDMAQTFTYGACTARIQNKYSDEVENER